MAAYQWFIEGNGQHHGPYSSADIKRLADTGKINPAHRIWRDGLPAWVEAATLEGLFAGVTAIATVQPPPLPSRSVPPPLPRLKKPSNRFPTWLVWVGTPVVVVVMVVLFLSQGLGQSLPKRIQGLLVQETSWGAMSKSNWRIVSWRYINDSYIVVKWEYEMPPPYGVPGDWTQVANIFHFENDRWENGWSTAKKDQKVWDEFQRDITGWVGKMHSEN